MKRTDDEWIALAALAGAEITSYEYAHPERNKARMYWTAPIECGRIAFGYTRPRCARQWLIATRKLPPR